MDWRMVKGRATLVLANEDLGFAGGFRKWDPRAQERVQKNRALARPHTALPINTCSGMG